MAEALTSSNNPSTSTPTGSNGFTAPASSGPAFGSSVQTAMNPNFGYDNAAMATAPAGKPVSTSPSPISVSGISTAPAPINVPTPPTSVNPQTTNASVPNPIPTVADIVNQNNTTTSTQQTQSDLLGKIAAATNTPSLATQQINAENSAGVPALSKTMNDLSTQLNGLNDQSTALSNDAMAEGTIDNQIQNKAQGTNDTGGGLAPIRADQLRANQIQQATIASRSLTVKSAYYAASGNYTLAKDAADKAAQVAFDADTQQLNYQKALLAQIQPQLDKDQAAQAAILKGQLDDRATQIANQQSDFKTGQALALTAMQNNASDPAAQFAAQQAMKLDPKSPTYLRDVTNLVGKYQTNEVQTQLDNQLKQAQINSSNASTAKSYNDIRIANMGAQTPNGSVPGTTGNPAIDVTSQGYSTQPIAGGLTQASIDQKALYYLTSGTVPPQGRTGAAGIQNAAISNRMAEMAPNGNLAGNKAQIKSYSDSLATQQKYLDSTQRAFNTANENLTALEQFMQTAGVNTASTIPLINSLNNAVKARGLDPGTVAGYQAAIAGLRAEYAQVLSRGGEVTEGQRSQASSLIPDNLTPAQLQQVADRLNIEGTNAVGQAQNQVQKIQGQINGIISPTSNSAASLPPEVDTALSSNAKVDDGAKTVTIPRSVWSQYPSSMDAIKAGIEAKGYKLLIQ